MNLHRFAEALVIPAAIISVISGLVSIHKDAPWFIYVSCFALSIFFFLVFFKKGLLIKNNFERMWEIEHIDLISDDGKLAIYRNDVILKALKHNVQKFKIILHAEGSISDVTVHNGIIEKIEKQMDGYHIMTLLSAPAKKGDEVKFSIEGRIHDSFLMASEYWQTTSFSIAKKGKIIISFPNGRVFKEFKAFTINGFQKKLSSIQPHVEIVREKPSICFDIERSELFESYRIEWTW